MALVYYAAANTISSITGYNYVADLQYGSDGQGWGAPELDAGSANSKVTENVTWDGDGDESNGVDSGWLAACYTFQAGANGLTWVTGNAGSQLKFGVGTVPSIKQITLRAAVQNETEMLWRSTLVSFYNGTTLRESVSLSDFGVDHTPIGSGTTGESTVRILPAYSDTNRVTVSAQVRMVSPEGVYPDSYDMFSQVFAFVGTRQGSSMLSGSGSDSLQLAPAVQFDPRATVNQLAATPFSDELLGTDTVPDMFGSADPTLL